MTKFDLQEAQKKAGSLYKMQMPEPDCEVCKGEGIRTMTICIGMDRQESKTYCDCTIEGFK